MGVGGGGHGHGCDPGIGEHGVEVVGHRHRSPAAGGPGGPVDVEVADPEQLGVGGALDVADQVGSPVAGAHDGEAEGRGRGVTVHEPSWKAMSTQ